MPKQDFYVDRTEIIETDAAEVFYCPCGSPVVREPRAVDAHLERCHPRIGAQQAVEIRRMA